MSRIAFTADVAPLSVNRAYAPARWGKRHGFRKTEAAEAYADRLRLSVNLRMGVEEWKPLTGPCSVVLRFYWPTKRGDVDGPVKLTLDALQGYAYENDKQIVRLAVERHTDKVRPRVEVEVVADDSQEAACAPRPASQAGSAAEPATPPPARPGTPASALAENTTALLFTGRRPARARTLANQRKARSSRKDYRP